MQPSVSCVRSWLQRGGESRAPLVVRSLTLELVGVSIWFVSLTRLGERLVLTAVECASTFQRRTQVCPDLEFLEIGNREWPLCDFEVLLLSRFGPKMQAVVARRYVWALNR